MRLAHSTQHLRSLKGIAHHLESVVMPLQQKLTETQQMYRIKKTPTLNEQKGGKGGRKARVGVCVCVWVCVGVGGGYANEKGAVGVRGFLHAFSASPPRLRLRPGLTTRTVPRACIGCVLRVWNPPELTCNLHVVVPPLPFNKRVEPTGINLHVVDLPTFYRSPFIKRPLPGTCTARRSCSRKLRRESSKVLFLKEWGQFPLYYFFFSKDRKGLR